MKTNEVLIAERNSRKITQRALALKSGVSNATISRIESGIVVPDVSTLEKLATALNLDMNYLLGRQTYTKMNRIKELRINNNLTQTMLANVLNIANNTLSQYENDQRQIPDEIKMKIADYFGVSVDYLLGRQSSTSMVNLKELRKSKNMTLKELGILINVSESAVSQYESGKRSPDYSTLVKIAEVFNVSVDYLLGRQANTKMTRHSNLEVVRKDARMSIDAMEKIPLLGATAAGTPIEAIENNDIDDYIYFDTSKYSSPVFALNIVGSSMEPRIFEGDTAIIEVTGFVNSGEVAAVKVNGNYTTLKQLKFESGGMWLIGFNPSFKPIFYTAKECTELPVTVIGKLIEVRQQWK